MLSSADEAAASQPRTVSTVLRDADAWLSTTATTPVALPTQGKLILPSTPEQAGATQEAEAAAEEAEEEAEEEEQSPPPPPPPPPSPPLPTMKEAEILSAGRSAAAQRIAEMDALEALQLERASLLAGQAATFEREMSAQAVAHASEVAVLQAELAARDAVVGETIHAVEVKQKRICCEGQICGFIAVAMAFVAGAACAALRGNKVSVKQ